MDRNKIERNKTEVTTQVTEDEQHEVLVNNSDSPNAYKSKKEARGAEVEEVETEVEVVEVP